MKAQGCATSSALHMSLAGLMHDSLSERCVSQSKGPEAGRFDEKARKGARCVSPGGNNLFPPSLV